MNGQWFTTEGVARTSRVTFRPDGSVTHTTVATGGVSVRKYRDRQMWRRRIAWALYRAGRRLSRIADRIDPWVTR